MDFEISHSFDAPPEHVAEVILDEDFQHELGQEIGVLKERRLLSQEDKDGRLVRRTRCVLDIQLNDIARRFIGNGDPAWVEEAVWHPEDMRWEWKIHPEIAGDMLSASGTIEIGAEGDSARRTVSGKVKIKGVPIYGGKVEGWVVQGIERAYEEEAEHLTAWLEREKR